MLHYLHAAGGTLRTCIGVGIDGHSLLLAGDATLLTRRDWNRMMPYYILATRHMHICTKHAHAHAHAHVHAHAHAHAHAHVHAHVKHVHMHMRGCIGRN